MTSEEDRRLDAGATHGARHVETADLALQQSVDDDHVGPLGGDALDGRLAVGDGLGQPDALVGCQQLADVVGDAVQLLDEHDPDRLLLGIGRRHDRPAIDRGVVELIQAGRVVGQVGDRCEFGPGGRRQGGHSASSGDGMFDG